MYTPPGTTRLDTPPVSLGTLQKMKAGGEKIACITCYDASFAVLCDAADADLVLVGDSLGMVLQGHDTTVPVTMDDIIYHSQSVARGLHRPFLVADLPFASYPTPDIALAIPCASCRKAALRW
jgi:3-methyl-2-oxobutanoate hydroxymethyltransferase